MSNNNNNIERHKRKLRKDSHLGGNKAVFQPSKRKDYLNQE